MLRQGVDARLLAEANLWAGETAASRNEVFNITNGGLFRWSTMWPFIGELLGMNVARLWAFELVGPGEIKRLPWPSPNGGKLVCGMPDYQLFDSLAVEANGDICVATLFKGAITVISPDGKIVEQIPFPDLYTTNICFGGPELRTAYITLSHSGRLVATEWPRPGLRLAG